MMRNPTGAQRMFAIRPVRIPKGSMRWPEQRQQ
jgi:hypothetical protein